MGFFYFYNHSKKKERDMEKKLTRSNNSMVAGVCSGIAKYLGWDITVVRIVYVLASIFTAFAGVLVYLILWIVMPAED
jgi:phage shock protein PspC (stress-responsive transcriptional regulator)